MKPTKFKQLFPSAPENIQLHLGNRSLNEVPTIFTDSRVFRVTDQEETLFLKIQSTTAVESFTHEVQILRWLKGKLPVPEVIEFTQDTQWEYMLLSEVAGINCVDAMETYNHTQIVRRLAQGLRAIHALDISECPFDERIAEKLRKAEKNLKSGLVQEEDFDEERQGMTGKQILNVLWNNPPPESDLVFNHGDYCLPNILVKDNQVSGFIDLGRAGVSDRYNDLAIASRSVRFNLGATLEQVFLESYGIDAVDEEKISYYRMMDELF